MRPPQLVPLLLSLLLCACAAPMASRGTPEAVTVGIVAINDFHGSLEPPKQSVAVPDGAGGLLRVPAGGAAWLATVIDSVRGKYANTVTVSAGDLIGASQLASSLYLDEPTVEVMNRMGLEFNAVGNHEFDRGRAELVRMQEGGCARNTTREPCRLESFKGARFRFLSASTVKENGATLFPATGLKHFGHGRGQVTVGLIGLTLKGTPELVSPGGIKGLTFGDEAEAINAAVPRLKAQGADAVVVLIHQGGRTHADSDPRGCDGLAGDITAILDGLSPGVDVVVSGHTHAAYVCDYKGILLTSAGSYGEIVTDIELRIDPAESRVLSKRAGNAIVQSQPYAGARGAVANTAAFPRFEPRADIAEYVARYALAASRDGERPVGRLAGPAARRVAGDVDFGGPLGNLIADAQLAATRGAGAQIAFMNPFGIRAPIVPLDGGLVTFGMIYATQPFNNQLVTQTLSGAEIKELLEQSFADSGTEQFLTPSQGFSYSVDRLGAPGARVSSILLDGKPLDPAASYRVTTNAFLAGGGDGFTVFTKGREQVVGMTDIEALEAWLKAEPARAVPEARRVIERNR